MNVIYLFAAVDNVFLIISQITFANNFVEFIDIKFRFGQTFFQKCFQINVMFLVRSVFISRIVAFGDVVSYQT